MPGPYDPYIPINPPSGSSPFPGYTPDVLERLARQMVARSGMAATGGRIVRIPEIPGLNAGAVRPLIPMIQTGSGRPIIDIAGRDPITWNAAKGTAQAINAQQAANQAAINERMAAYNAARPMPSQGTVGGRPVIQVGVNAGPSIATRIGGGGARLFGR